MRNNCRKGLTWCFAAAISLLLAAPTHGETNSSADNLLLSCGQAPPGHPTKGRRDYRLMSSNEKDLRDLRYHEYFHIEPARKALSSGNLKWNVMNNLHFVLQKIPNDHRALSILVQWDKAGGRDSDYASPACYLTWAQQFTPDDAAVWVFGGYYFYQKKDVERAKTWWEQALALEPGNADVHYNLGLLMFEQGLYAGSRTHAQAAYAAGFPLPGLREKLQGVGEWQSISPEKSGSSQ